MKRDNCSAWLLWNTFRTWPWNSYKETQISSYRDILSRGHLYFFQPTARLRLPTKPVLTMSTPSSWSDPSHGVPPTRPQPSFLHSRGSVIREQPSLPWGSNFWDTDCEDSKVLVYATEVLAWLLGGHSYGHCLLSELQIVRKWGGSNHNPSAPWRWLPSHEKNLLQTVGVLFPCSLIESLVSAQKPPHNSVFFSGVLGLISFKTFLSFISSPFLII